MKNCDNNNGFCRTGAGLFLFPKIPFNFLGKK